MNPIIEQVGAPRDLDAPCCACRRCCSSVAPTAAVAADATAALVSGPTHQRIPLPAALNRSGCAAQPSHSLLASCLPDTALALPPCHPTPPPPRPVRNRSGCTATPSRASWWRWWCPWLPSCRQGGWGNTRRAWSAHARAAGAAEAGRDTSRLLIHAAMRPWGTAHPLSLLPFVYRRRPLRRMLA